MQIELNPTPSAYLLNKFHPDLTACIFRMFFLKQCVRAIHNTLSVKYITRRHLVGDRLIFFNQLDLAKFLFLHISARYIKRHIISGGNIGNAGRRFYMRSRNGHCLFVTLHGQTAAILKINDLTALREIFRAGSLHFSLSDNPTKKPSQ